MPKIYKALSYLGNYVDTARLPSGIYHTTQPILFDFKETIDSIAERFKGLQSNLDGKPIYDEVAIRNLLKCELVDYQIAYTTEQQPLHEYRIYDVKNNSFIYSQEKYFDILLAAHKNGHNNDYRFDLLTPFTDKNNNKLYVGDFIIKDKDQTPLLICYGKCFLGVDSWGINYNSYGFYIKFYSGMDYALLQEDVGYNIASSECTLVGNIHQHPTMASEKQVL